MGSKTTTTYFCDRCDAEIGDKLPKRAQESKVSGQFHYESGPGPTFTWKDLCNKCDTAVKLFFLEEQTSIPTSEGKILRERMRDLLQAQNINQIDHYLKFMFTLLNGRTKP